MELKDAIEYLKLNAEEYDAQTEDAIWILINHIEQKKCSHPDKCHECDKILTCTYYKE